jgi:hypothetical protein
MPAMGVTVTPLNAADIDRLLGEENERDAVNGTQEPVTEAEQQPEPRAEAGDDGERTEPAEPEPRVKPKQMSPLDEKRLAMAERFKRPDLETAPFDGDLTRAENLYGSVAAEQLEVDPDAPEPGVPAARQAPAQEEDRPHVIKVRGKELRLTTAELLERASKVEAADSYLAESRDLLEQAKSVRSGRTAADPQHPEDDNRARDDGLDSDNRQETRRPGIDLTEVVEQIQFGDPKEAAERLAQAIDQVATRQVNEGHVARLVSNDLARSKAALKAFTDANPDIAADPLASNLIENLVYSIYRDEIKALGVDEAQIPQDPKALADWHRLYRVHGHTVSKADDVLNKAKSRFEQWRGVSPQPAKPAPRKEAPRVAVNVDRTERRMAIPVQPSRGVAPRRDAAPVAQESSRKSAVQEMRRARGQIVN